MPKKKKKKDKKEGKKKGKGGDAKDEVQKPYEPPGASEKEITLRAEYVLASSLATFNQQSLCRLDELNFELTTLKKQVTDL